jgi:hypothetical protein
VAEKPEVEGAEDQDDADICRKPRPRKSPKKRDVNGHNDDDHDDRVENSANGSTHASSEAPHTRRARSSCLGAGFALI